MGEAMKPMAWQIQEHDGEWTDIAPSETAARSCLADGTVAAIRPLYASPPDAGVVTVSQALIEAAQARVAELEGDVSPGKDYRCRLFFAEYGAELLATLATSPDASGLREALEVIAAGMTVILHTGETVVMERDDASAIARAALKGSS